MSDSKLSRRDFVRRSSATLGAVALGAQLGSCVTGRVAEGDTLGVGVIGCGGRGTGAVRDCLTASPGVKLVAMGDLFKDKLDESRKRLAKLDLADRCAGAADERCFAGFDAYSKVIACPDVDVVLLTEPPGFRPKHLAEAVRTGKHVFMEKPVAVDPVGVRAVIEAGEAAKKKRLSIVAGTQYRRQDSYVKAIEKIHDGAIGKLVAGQGYYNTSTLWQVPRTDAMSDMEWQCRNWYYFTWLCGDHMVEQCVHNIDAINWVFQAPPVKAIATGGRLVRTDKKFGEIYDHFTVDYEYPGNVHVMVMCRQMAGAATRLGNHIVGTKGVADVDPGSSNIHSHDGKQLFRHPERGNNPYVQEHADLIASIRRGQPLNEAAESARSTLTAIMGREAAYSGDEVTWDQAMNSTLDLSPKEYQFGALSDRPIPMPGTRRSL